MAAANLVLLLVAPVPTRKLTLFVNQAPGNGTVSAQPMSGVSLHTNFTVKVRAWRRTGGKGVLTHISGRTSAPRCVNAGRVVDGRRVRPAPVVHLLR